ncbi:MAG: tRNA (cytidine(34)-2'-O)-methyltransferase [Polyangiales bacterium]
MDIPDTRLRVPPLTPPLHVALVEPEIPPNTGNVARLCAATCAPMHLIGPLGFKIDAPAVKRAGIDYWHLVDVRRHLDFAHFAHAHAREVEALSGRAPKRWLFTAHATRSWFDPSVDVGAGDALVFGRESVGLPKALVEANEATCVALPTMGMVRSHNLANAVSIALYEALRRLGALGPTALG